MINPIETYNEYLKEINGYEQKKRLKDNPDRLSASGAGMCHRKHYYNINKGEKKPISEDSLRILRLGSVMGEEFRKAIDNVALDDTNLSIYQETLLSSDSLMVRGHCDLLLVENGIGKMYDWKTCNSFKFKHIENGNHKSENYELQVGTYCIMALEMGLCKEINHMAILYYSKHDSKMREYVIQEDAIDRAREYWKSVYLNIRKASEPLMIDIEFKEGIAPVYKWECGRYCDYSRICPSPLNKEFVK